MLQNYVAPNIGQKMSSNLWTIILVAGLYTTCPGERVLVVIRLNATLLPLRLYCEKNVYLFVERCRKSNNVWLRALMQSHSLYSSLFFEHYNRILFCDWVLGRYSVCCLRTCHTTTHPYFTWPWPRLDQCTKCSGFTNNSDKKVSVTLLFYLQPRYLIVLLCLFLSICIVQAVFLYSMDFMSVRKP